MQITIHYNKQTREQAAAVADRFSEIVNELDSDTTQLAFLFFIKQLDDEHLELLEKLHNEETTVASIPSSEPEAAERKHLQITCPHCGLRTTPVAVAGHPDIGNVDHIKVYTYLDESGRSQLDWDSAEIEADFEYFCDLCKSSLGFCIEAHDWFPDKPEKSNQTTNESLGILGH